MEQDKVYVGFPGASAAEANGLAAELVEFLHAQVPQVTAVQEREDPRRQDAGIVVALVGMLSLGVAPALARGVATWMAKRSLAELHLSRRRKDSGEVVTELKLEGRPSARTMRVIEGFFEETRDTDGTGDVQG
ncbi:MULTISPECIES: hypothetical protein [unclassified Streptomyces]|uniref:hypothetical protein n=1 Tax=unclassified Streptomyces TaxID=2593676 RepID=UPI0022B5ECF6|nr:MULTISPECIES: hypothetical protein [unclassified Streptomyces]MCZ7417224.1 hypothetical protein [Streptomyces sp. WMMC897]MCZ7432948.1 hypothetical protein [Streptomyces sp. WMMC1477]